jgi:hypothetical protein
MSTFDADEHLKALTPVQRQAREEHLARLAQS